MFKRICWILIIVSVLVNVAFFTLYERKFLGLIQSRKGPSKVGFLGIFQPFSDAIKLFSKENRDLTEGEKGVFWFSPSLIFIFALVIWSVIPLKEMLLTYYSNSMVLLVLLRFGVYPLFLIGWSSNSKYSIVGALRGIAQTISYEIRLALVLFSILIFSRSHELDVHLINVLHYPMIIICPIRSFFWFVSCVAETNRTPFDFSEGESELVSGFNTEYSGSLFALIFIAEYRMILFFSLTSVLLIFGGRGSKAWIGLMIIILASIWIWLRRAYPRYRYDKLITLAWKRILPCVLIILFYRIFMIYVII